MVAPDHAIYHVVNESIAHILYTTYCEAVGGKAFNGDPLPTWKEFRADPSKQLQSDAWMAVAKTVAASTFESCFGNIQRTAHQVNRQNGWWEKRDRVTAILAKEGINNIPNMVIELLGLADSENAEAMEAARKHPPDTWGDATKKDTLVRELAGCIVRHMDLAEALGLPLGKAIIEEINANATRGHMHGGKAA